MQHENTQEPKNNDVFGLKQFVDEFGEDLLKYVSEQTPPLFNGDYPSSWDAVIDNLSRAPFAAQRRVIASIATLLFIKKQTAGVINAEMGTGKTIMAIAIAAIAKEEGFSRSLIISPPHLVYKWRREILTTIPNAKVVILNGSSVLTKLLKIRADILNGTTVKKSSQIHFYILGRVRMRMGFHWRALAKENLVPIYEEDDDKNSDAPKLRRFIKAVTCSNCGRAQYNEDKEVIKIIDSQRQLVCTNCQSPLWTLIKKSQNNKNSKRTDTLIKALCQIPTIGKKTAENLLNRFGEDIIKNTLGDNIHQFVNLMDEDGELFFSDRKSLRIEKALSKTEFSFGQGGYQPSEFIKRYLPDNFFDLLIVDEGHEYKNGDSAQGLAMGVLASKCPKVLLLTGTLMGGYASDLFYLLWRLNPKKMIECGFKSNQRGSLGSASMSFMREHGVLKDIFKEVEGNAFKTARGSKKTVHTVKAPGFGPKGIVEHIVPITAFLKLKEISQNVLPHYQEDIVSVEMTPEQEDIYGNMSAKLGAEMRKCLARGDTSLLGVVLNVLLRWPDTGFATEMVIHPRTKDTLLFQEAIFDDDTLSPKEMKAIEYIKSEKIAGRKVLVYTTYTGKRDIAARLKRLFSFEGIKTTVLRSSVATDKREDWIMDQVDKGIDALICNPELVKTGLDLLDFPSIVFMQTGYNVYTVQQAARRSFRIGQTVDVKVVFLGYKDTAQTTCMQLMGKKITVAQSTSGDIPDNGLDALNNEEQSIEMELAKQLIHYKKSS